MADIVDILAKTKEVLENAFNIQVIDKDIKEDIERPAFIINTDEITKNKFGLMDHISFRMHIYYFSAEMNNRSAELHEMLNNIENLFAGRIKINDTFNFTLEEQKGKINMADMTAELYGLIDIVDPYLEDAEGVDMQELDVNLNKEGE